MSAEVAAYWLALADLLEALKRAEPGLQSLLECVGAGESVVDLRPVFLHERIAARLKALPLPPPDAAPLTGYVRDAVQVSHQLGRDLGLLCHIIRGLHHASTPASREHLLRQLGLRGRAIMATSQELTRLGTAILAIACPTTP